MMRRGQISVEYMIIFSIALIIFIIFGIVLRGSLTSAANSEQIADRMLKQVKLHAITASTSNSDYSAQLAAPTTINGEPVNLTVLGAPDNLALIVRERDGQILGRTQLPDIDDVDTSGPDGTITIQRVDDRLEVIV